MVYNKAVLKRKFIEINAYIKLKIFKQPNVTLQRTGKRTKPKFSRWRKLVQTNKQTIRQGINEVVAKKHNKKISDNRKFF